MSWLPVDIAASTALDLAGLGPGAYDPSAIDSDPNLVYHVLNPFRFHWTRDLLPSLQKAGLVFETLPTSEWMQKLRDSSRDPKTNPPIRLLDWFESKYGHKAKLSSPAAEGPLIYATDATTRDSVALRTIPLVTDVAFVKMIIDRLKHEWQANSAIESA